MKCWKVFHILLLLLVLSEDLHKQAQAHGPCETHKTLGQMSLNCSHQNLSYIPNVDSSIKILIFGFNELTNITLETFRNVSRPENIVGLQLDDNKIQNISSDALNAFQNLKALYLSNNPIYYDNLRNVLGTVSKLQSLRELRISGIRTIQDKEDLFSLMIGNHIKSLGVEQYEMKTFSFDTFKMFSNLETFHLEHNHIENIFFSKFRHIRSIYLKYNDLESVPKFSVNNNKPDCYFPKLEILNVNYNRILNVRKNSFRCLRNLKGLFIAGNHMKTLPNDVFGEMPRLTFIDIKYVPALDLHIEPFALRSNSLEVLELGFRADAGNVFVSVDETFKHCPNLKKLTLTHTSMNYLSEQILFRLFSPLKGLVKFVCYACKISQDPISILSTMEDVETVDLRNNLITILSEKTFMNNKHLKSLTLRFNQLGYVYKSALPESLLNNLAVLDLSNNPFVCDCDLEWFITWMKTKEGKKVLKPDPRQYRCSKPANKQNKKISDISFSYKECHPWSPWIWTAVIGSPIAFVLCIVIIFLYRNRWNIKHYVFLLRKRRNYQKIPGDMHKYDAFVAYEGKDSAWVRRRLLPVLEGDVGLKLCIHERDFHAGAFINDNIVTNIGASEKVIAVLTNAFARSDWCMFELKVAHSKLIENETELIIILLENIYAKNMNQSLKALFATTTYIQWTEDRVGQDLFWEKLKNVLKK